MTAPRRRWFRFGPQTMFAMAAVAAIPFTWFGLQAKTVTDRQRAISVLERDGADVSVFRSIPFYGLSVEDTIERRKKIDEIRQQRELTPIRGWLGDQPVGEIELPFIYNDADLARVQALFPEAEVIPFQAARH
jgi:hypothetical protein